MNIGVFLGEFEPELGGNYTFQGNILRRLETARTNHSFFVFYTGGKPVRASGKLTYVPLLGIGRLMPRFVKSGLYLLKGIWCRLLRSALKRHGIDIVWFVTHRFEPVDIPFICTVLDLEHRIHPFFPEVSVTGSTWDDRERLFRAMIPRAAYVICGTNEGKRQILNFYHPDENRVRVVPFPIPSFALEGAEAGREFTSKYRLDKEYLFYPAQFWPHKNHIALLRALRLLRDNHRLDMLLVFCGSDKGNLSYLKETARDWGLQDHVRFLGFVPTNDLFELYRRAFALTFVSTFGPDNLPPIEAFAIGCPVIASSGEGASEQLGDAALLVNPLSEEEIAGAVRKLHDESATRAALIRKGKERARNIAARDYLREMALIFDEFDRYRRCWSKKNKYVHL